MNNIKKLIACLLIVGSQVTELYTAQESKKRKTQIVSILESTSRTSERLEQAQLKKMRLAQENNDPLYHHHHEQIQEIVKNLPILDEGFQLLGKGKDGLADFLLAKYPFDAKEETFQDDLIFMNKLPHIITQAEEVIQEDEHMEKVFTQTLWSLTSSSYPNPQENLIEHKDPMMQYIIKHPIFMWPTIQKWINKPNHTKSQTFLLNLAAAINHVKMAQILIKSMGANVNVQSQDCKRTPLHYAISHNHPNIIKILLATRGINVHLQDSSVVQQPALHKIINLPLKHELIILDLFIQAKANVNSIDKDGNTLLHIIVKPGYNDKTKAIFEKLMTAPHLDLNIQNNQGQTALHNAVCAFEDFNTVEGFITVIKQMITILINAQAKLDMQDNNGDTPLHLASNKHYLHDTVKKLLDARADTNIKNKKGNTPLHLAVLKGSIPITQQLLEAGTDRNIMNNDFYTAEELAINKVTATTQELTIKRSLLTLFAQFNQVA